MANASNTDTEMVADSEHSVKHKVVEFLTSVVGKTFLVVVLLVLFGRLLDWVAVNTGLIAHSTMISLAVGIAYSLAGVIVLVGLVAGLVVLVR